MKGIYIFSSRDRRIQKDATDSLARARKERRRDAIGFTAAVLAVLLAVAILAAVGPAPELMSTEFYK